MKKASHPLNIGFDRAPKRSREEIVRSKRGEGRTVKKKIEIPPCLNAGRRVSSRKEEEDGAKVVFGGERHKYRVGK